MDKNNNRHKHDGVSEERVEYTDLSILPEATILPPSGGATVDANARATIGEILTLLRAKNLMK